MTRNISGLSDLSEDQIPTLRLLWMSRAEVPIMLPMFSVVPKDMVPSATGRKNILAPESIVGPTTHLLYWGH